MNKYSFASLVGALELDRRLEDLKIIPNKGVSRKFLDRLLKVYDQIILCYSFMSPKAGEVISNIKKLRLSGHKNVTYIAGGSHSTGELEKTIKVGFDAVIVGEGERSFPELVYRIVYNKSYEDLEGIAFQNKEGRIQINRNREQVDLNSTPPFAFKHKLFAPIEISRGCPWGCKFCQTPRIFGFNIRHRNVDCIVKYAKLAVKHGYNKTWFITSNAFAYGSKNGKVSCVEKIRKLLMNLRKVNGLEEIFFGTFPSEVRPEFVGEEIMDLVTKYTSNKKLTIGAQTGSQKMLNLIGRGHDVIDVYKAVDLTLEVNIIPHLDFIFGLPGETEEDLDQTKQMIKEVVNLGAKIHAHTFMPLPGTPFEKESSGILDKETKKFLSSLAKIGKVDGYWLKQVKISEELFKMKRDE